MTCPLCRNVGWLLLYRHAEQGSSTGPMSLELAPCLHPECDAYPPRPIGHVRGPRSVPREVVLHPSDGRTVMALTGFTGPAWQEHANT